MMIHFVNHLFHIKHTVHDWVLVVTLTFYGQLFYWWGWYSKKQDKKKGGKR